MTITVLFHMYLDVTVSLTLIYLRKMLTDASPCETTDSVNAATVEDPLPYYTCDTGTQCILKPLGRSHGKSCYFFSG